MGGSISSLVSSVVSKMAARRVAWRRARKLRQGERARPRIGMAIPVAGLLAAVSGALLIAAHARHIGASAAGPGAAGAFHALLPGATFEVPKGPGVTVSAHPGVTLVVASGMRGDAPVRVNLCTQLQDHSHATSRLAPLRIGYRFEDIARLAQPGQVALHNVALAGPDSPALPRVLVTGSATGPLKVRWEGGSQQARWASDSAAAHSLRHAGWLVWPGGALHLQRRPSSACARAGELVVRLLRSGNAASPKATVTAYPDQGDPVSALLPPGRYTVPTQAPVKLEDQALFNTLQARGLVRLGRTGLIEVVPRDLAAWRAAPGTARAGELAGWRALTLDAETGQLIERLYRMADGRYVRHQIEVFNSERRLLGWRMRGGQAGQWQAGVGEAPASTASGMPLSGTRLFAQLPHGWGEWRRVDGWPVGAAGEAARLSLSLARPGETVELMLAGRLLAVEGAELVGGARAACTGRACPSADAVQILTLRLPAGGRSVTLTARALDMASIDGPGDQQYRHLRLAGGKLAWHALPAPRAWSAHGPADPVTLADRHGTVLWSGGAPTQAAVDAGLAAMLGLHEQHAGSVAGMLARLPPAGQAHHARLSLDLGLQAAAQRILDCVGMRRGRWDGRRCGGGQAAPSGRQAGMVIVDLETGDVLAAANSGSVPADVAKLVANWDEVRDFDRANPAASALRLPAFQHDGGVHRAPGSTFKIVSALGLELAAQRDPKLGALLGGLPLADINRMAQQKGFAFQTTAATYPFGTRLAHITNYKDQHLDRRAVDGRLGLAQALTYSLNTWFAWSGELSDRSLMGRADGGVPDLQPLQDNALDGVRPIVAMARRLGFGQALRLDGGLLPEDYEWSHWDALQASPAEIDPVRTRHELRQMAIGLRMQATPLHMALVAGAVGQGTSIAPRLLLELDGREAVSPEARPLGVRLDRVRAGLKGVVDMGTAAGAFRDAGLAPLRRGLFGKTGTSPSTDTANSAGNSAGLSTAWFTGWLEPGSLPGQRHRLAVAAFVSHSETTGGEHVAPVVAALLRHMAVPKPEQRGK